MPPKKQQGDTCFIECITSFIEGDNAIRIIHCLKFSKIKIIIFMILLNCLFPFLIYWSLFLRKYLLFCTCSLKDAKYFWIENQDGSQSISKKIITKVKRSHKISTFETIGFTHRNMIYHYDVCKNKFKVLELDIQIVFNEILKQYGAGLTMDLYQEYRSIFGKCMIEIKIPNIFELFLKEIISPINFIQIGCLAEWFINDYMIYAIVVLCLSISSAFLNLIIIRSHFLNLKSMSANQTEIEVIRVINYQKEKFLIHSAELVPGDVIVLKNGLSLPCDCLLLNNYAVVNEININGEPTPKIKSGIPHSEKIYSIYDKSHTLFESTLIAQVKKDEIVGGDTLALVIRTGYYSVQGELFRNIIYSTQNRLRFLIVQIFKYIIIMFTLAITGNLIKLFKVDNWDDSSQIAVEFLDLITVAIAPALPTCIFIGIFLSIRALKKRMISCYSPYRLLTAGSIEYLFLDKTGTLTEKNLILKNIQLVYENKFQESLSEVQKNLSLDSYDNVMKPTFQEVLKELFNLVSCCHNIVEVMKKENNKELIGDHLDLKMFEFSRGQIHFFKEGFTEERLVPQALFKIKPPWKTILKTLINDKNTETMNKNNLSALKNNKQDESELEIISVQKPEVMFDSHEIHEKIIEEAEEELYSLKIFEFSSEVQRMSVITYSKQNNLLKCYTKGSPESIKDLCVASSIPQDFNMKLLELTKAGLVVLAMAYKALDFSQLSIFDRTNCESNLIFLGFLTFENPLKLDSIECFKILHSSGIEPKIVTGDSATTAMIVAHKIGLVDNLNSTSIIDYQDSKVIVQEDIFSINETLKKKEYSTFLINLEKDSQKNFERMFMLKAVSSDSQNYLYLSNLKNSSVPPQRKQILSESTPFLKDFFQASKQFLSNDIVLTGKAFKYFFVKRYDSFSSSEKKILHLILKKTKIFSRMLPMDKANLMKLEQNLGYMVGMVGDGLNDAAALKQADVGLSFSETNVNLSSSFSTKRTSLSSFIDLLIEGRKTVSNISHTFKYFALYSLIQFTNVNVLIVFKGGITNTEYLIEDLFIATVLVLASSLTTCSLDLSKSRPVFDIFSITNIFSILGTGLIQLGGQIGITLYIRSQDWFISETDDDQSDLYEYCAYCQDSNALFMYSVILLINSILMTGNFMPDRQPFYKNWVFIFLFLLLNIYANIAILYPASRLAILELDEDSIPQKDLFIIWGSGWTTVFFFWLWENIVCRRIISEIVNRASKKIEKMNEENGNEESSEEDSQRKLVYKKFLVDSKSTKTATALSMR